MNTRPRILSAIALTALVGVLTAPPAQAQQVDSTTDYRNIARRYYHPRHVHHHRTPTAPPAAVAPAAPVVVARASAVASPVRTLAPAVAPVVAAPAPASAVPAPAAPSPVAAAPVPTAPSPVAAAPAPALTAAPLPVRHGRPLVMAAAQTYPRGGWKILAGFAGLGLALFLWKRRVPVSTLATDCQIQVVTRTFIGGKCELLVVDVGGQRMLLGASSGTVQFLAALEGPEPLNSSDSDKTAGFESMFAAARSRTREKSAEPRFRETASELPRDATRATLNSQALRREAPARKSSAPEGQVAGLLALGAYR